MKKTQAFTLVEILVVATIIGVLATVGVVSYSRFAMQSRDARRRADLESIRTAVEQYRSINNTYPATLTFGGSLCDPAGCATGTYMSKVPTDPKTAQSYYFTGTANDYTLGAYIESGSSGSCGSCVIATCNLCYGPYGER